VVFPSVGRASVVLGGAYGKGQVFEQGQPIGFATISQMTIGVQVGGQTFTQLLLFDSKPALDEFRNGRLAFTGNASAVIVKAAASGTTNHGTVRAHAYSRGGMLLELSLGGAKFNFIPPEQAAEKLDKPGRERGHEEGHEQGQEEGHAEGGHDGRRAQGAEERLKSLANRGAAGLRQAGGAAGRLLRGHPLASAVVGLVLAGGGIAAAVVPARRRRLRALKPEGAQ
jgi:hypothetical protein